MTTTTRSKVVTLAAAGVLAASFLGPACDGKSGAGSDAAGADAAGETSAACAADTRAQIYASGLEARGGSGALELTLQDAMPAPPATGVNKWLVRVADGTGAPVDGVTFTVTPFMPDHGHGTSVKATVTGEGEGKYTIDGIYLFLAGYWTVTIEMKAPGGATDQGVFGFCLP